MTFKISEGLIIAEAETLFDEHPNFDEQNDSLHKCRIDLNKEYPRAKYFETLSSIKKNTVINKFILTTQIGFTNG